MVTDNESGKIKITPSYRAAILDHPLVVATAVFGIRVLAAISSFVFTILITRSIGASGAGIFFTGLSVVTVASILFRFGADGATLKYVAREYGLGRNENARSYFLLGLVTSVIGGIIGTLLLYAAVQTGIHVFGLDVGYGTYLAAFCLSLLPISLIALLSDSLKATGRVVVSVAVAGLINFVVAGALLFPLHAWLGDIGVTFSYLAGLAIAVLFATVLLRGYLATDPVVSVPIADYMQSLRHFWLIGILNRGIGPYAPLLLLSIFSTADQVGIFGTAFRVAMVLSLFLAAANTVLAPRISHLYHHGEIDELCHLTRRFAFFQNLLVVPLLVAMVAVREPLMGLFGPEFVSGATVFAVLASAQVFNSLTGSVGNILVMTGHERDMWCSSVTGMVLMLVASILLVPSNAALGAAISTATGVVTTNTAALLFVRWRLGFLVVPWLGSCDGADTMSARCNK